MNCSKLLNLLSQGDDSLQFVVPYETDVRKVLIVMLKSGIDDELTSLLSQR